MRFHLRLHVVAAAVVASAGCVNLIGPSDDSRKDPGTLIVRVRDQSGAAVQNAWVYVELPNNVGSFFKEGTPTRADGTATFYYVPAGRRPVEIKVPAGYEPDGEVKHDVDVVKGQSVTTQFTLRRI